MICPCCSGKNYAECCEIYHLGKENAPTAEALMRSRFSAYAIPNGAYLMQTTYPSKRFLHSAKDMQEWGEINEWQKLEIVATPATNQVEFKAFYKDSEGNPQIHHELSTFKKENHQWYYLTGKFK